MTRICYIKRKDTLTEPAQLAFVHWLNQSSGIGNWIGHRGRGLVSKTSSSTNCIQKSDATGKNLRKLACKILMSDDVAYIMLTNLRTPAFSCSSRMVDGSDIFSFFTNQDFSLFFFTLVCVMSLMLQLCVTNHKSLFCLRTLQNLYKKRTCHVLLIWNTANTVLGVLVYFNLLFFFRFKFFWVNTAKGNGFCASWTSFLLIQLFQFRKAHASGFRQYKSGQNRVEKQNSTIKPKCRM